LKLIEIQYVVGLNHSLVGCRFSLFEGTFWVKCVSFSTCFTEAWKKLTRFYQLNNEKFTTLKQQFGYLVNSLKLSKVFQLFLFWKYVHKMLMIIYMHWNRANCNLKSKKINLEVDQFSKKFNSKLNSILNLLKWTFSIRKRLN
jgi:hypothetical protein